jgi:hypothetical protein
METGLVEYAGCCEGEFGHSFDLAVESRRNNPFLLRGIPGIPTILRPESWTQNSVN